MIKGLWQRLSAGTLGGLAGTVVMSVGMLAARRAGLLGEQPPVRLVRTVLPGGHPRKPRANEDVLASLAHVGFGVAGGVAYGLVVPRRLAGKLSGITYGLGVWGVSYQGWMPAIGAMPPADEDRPGRPQAMAAVHVVYGAALGAVVRRRIGAAARAHRAEHDVRPRRLARRRSRPSRGRHAESAGVSGQVVEPVAPPT